MFGLILKQEVLNNVTFWRAWLFIYGQFDDTVDTIVLYLHKWALYTDLNFSFSVDKLIRAWYVTVLICSLNSSPHDTQMQNNPLTLHFWIGGCNFEESSWCL